MAGLSDINRLYQKYYADCPELRRIVVQHSELVAKKALKICKEKNLDLDPRDVYCAAMLHDIGVVKCNAPDIFARGNLPYIMHGIEGEKILMNEGLLSYARICSTHTGAGISAEEIERQKLPLPQKDMIPESLLEKLICYADKFFSKSKDITKEKTPEEIFRQMERFGKDSVARFEALHSLFGIVNK